MEDTLHRGDIIVVNKFSYGPKVPRSFSHLPIFNKVLSKNNNSLDVEYKTLRSFEELVRNDIVVFKRKNQKDEYYVKRIIGLPGDTLRIQESVVLINDKPLKEKSEYSYYYTSIKDTSITKHYSNREWSNLANSEKENYLKDIFKKNDFMFAAFPIDKQNIWTRDNYGPIIIPKRGITIDITKENMKQYELIMKEYEKGKIDLKRDNNLSYTFENDYYFLMGDNRHGSVDSRSIGFIPMANIHGKMIYNWKKN